MKRAVRVALVSSDVSPQSGAARCLLALARGLQEEPGVMPILYLSEDGALGEDGRKSGLLVRITGVPRPSLRKGVRSLLGYAAAFPWQSAKLAIWLRRDQVDLVHANEFIEFQSGLAGIMAGVPRLFHVRYPLDSSRLYRALARITALLATDLVAVSRAAAEACFRACGRRCVVIYDPGPDTGTFRPSDSRAQVLREFSLPADSLIITLVSKLNPGKGHETLLAAAREVAGCHPDARFLIVGGELPGAESYAHHLYRSAEQHPIKGRVVFAGAREDVPRLLGASTIVVHLPTVRDSFPAVVLEAMSCACPVVASAVGGIPEQVDNGVDGILVPPGDVPAVATALERLLADEELRRRMGRAARESILARYGLQRHVGEIALRYREMLERRARIATER